MPPSVTPRRPARGPRRGWEADNAIFETQFECVAAHCAPMTAAENHHNQCACCRTRQPRVQSFGKGGSRSIPSAYTRSHWRRFGGTSRRPVRQSRTAPGRTDKRRDSSLSDQPMRAISSWKLAISATGPAGSTALPPTPCVTFPVYPLAGLCTDPHRQSGMSGRRRQRSGGCREPTSTRSARIGSRLLNKLPTFPPLR